MKNLILGVLVFFACNPNDEKEGFVFDDNNIIVTNSAGYKYIINKKNMLPIEVHITDKQLEVETIFYYNDLGELERKVLSDRNGKIVDKELYGSDKGLKLKKFYNNKTNYIEQLKYENPIVKELKDKDGKNIYAAHFVDGVKTLEVVVTKSHLLQSSKNKISISLEPALKLPGQFNYSINSNELDYHVEKQNGQSILHVKGELELYNFLEILIDYVPLMPSDTISAFNSILIFDLKKN